MGFEFESPWILWLLIGVPVFLLALRVTLLDSPRAQLWASAAVRIAVVLLLLLALANTLRLHESQHVSVLVLADMSDSVPEDAREPLNEFLTQLEGRASNPSKAGLVTFASEPTIVNPVENHPDFPEELDKPEEAGDTALEDALLLAREMLPADTVNRVVVFTDGNETLGDSMAAAKRLAARGIKVFPVPYPAAERDEILLEDLIVPPEVKRGQSFTISAVAHATHATAAGFALYRNGFKIQEKEINLEEGANTLTFDETNPPDGMTQYELRVTAQRDFYADNNVSSGIVFVSGEPKVLLLEGDEREGRYLARALAAENIQVEVREGRGMPGSLAEFAAFDAVILSDVPATDMSVQQMNLLRSYIEDLGGGFIMIGGEESFGIGGYYRTSIEDALPVRMRSEKKKDTPSLAMMLVVDKSGSMQGEKMDLAKEAAIATVELLNSRDYVGVIAFDGEAYWAVDLQSAGNQMGIVQTVETIEAGGGTSIYPGMEEAYYALDQVAATFKHVILLTDGHSQPGDFQGIVDQMVTATMTVSTVAVGDGADTALLQDMARWGKGRYYFTADPYDIPQIFTKETMTASKSSLVEEPFVAQVFRNHQVIQAIDWDTAPFLFGYVVTTPKATAEVLLVTERGDPLLATWRFGLGKSAAFTSDAKSRWAADWVGWPGYGKFWAQIIRDVMRTSQSRGNETKIAYAGASGAIVVDNINEFGGFVNDLNTTAQVIDPNLDVHDVALQQTAPGRYTADFPMPETGSYMVKIRQTMETTGGEGTNEEVVADYTRGVTISYKPEYRHLATNKEFLQQIAAATGGALSPSLDELFNVSENEAVVVRERIWPWLVAIALLLFVVDVALRRLDLAGFNFTGQPRRYG